MKIRTFLKRIAIATIKIVLPNVWQRLEQQKACLNDWAQLNLYQQSNSTLASPNSKEDRVIFFGDSITEFWDLETAFPQRNYINRGISGQTTPQMLIRFRPDVISLQPKVVLILAGINDLMKNIEPIRLESIKDNYLSIAQLAQINCITVIFASVLPVKNHSLIQQFDPRTPERIRILNQWLELYCNEQQHIYLNYHSHMVDSLGMLQTELSDDGVHPNAKGYSVMTSLAEAAINRAILGVSGHGRS